VRGDAPRPWNKKREQTRSGIPALWPQQGNLDIRPIWAKATPLHSRAN
jgi:hypothetical protein